MSFLFWNYVHFDVISCFKKNKENPLTFDVVIVDESSMIGTPLFSKLLNAIDPKKTKLILLGDANQLASVDVGSLFGDICLTQKQSLTAIPSSLKAAPFSAIL